MEGSKSYSTQDIEKLKQKIATYRDTLTTMKAGNPIDDYQFMKDELNSSKTQVSHLEGVMERMNDQQSMQVEGYEKQIENFSIQMDSLNQTIEGLNQDLSKVMKKLSNDRTEKINTPVDVQDSLNTVIDKKTNLIEETTQTKDQTSISSIQPSNRPPSYKQLQSLVGKAYDSQEVPSVVTPTVSIDSHKKYSEDQHFTKQSFPSTGTHPSQIYNGLYRNVNRASTIRLTNVVKKQALPISVHDNSNASLLLMNSELETPIPQEVLHATVTPVPQEVLNVTVTPVPQEVLNATVTPVPQEVLNASVTPVPQEVLNATVTPVPQEVLNATVTPVPQEVLNATVTPVPQEVLNATVTPVPQEMLNATVTPVPQELLNVATIEEDKAPIEISNTMKRQQHKNKETSSLLNFFRKKH